MVNRYKITVTTNDGRVPVGFTSVMKLSVFLITVYLISNSVSAESNDTSSFHDLPTPRKNENLIVRLYTRGSNLNAPTEVCEGCENVVFSRLSPNKRTKILIHGWWGDGQCLMYQELVQAYLRTSDYNIITVDWSNLGSKDKLYPNARGKISIVATKVAKVINSLVLRNGIKLPNLHIIGHSLGAHIAGLLTHYLGLGRIGRITGLDPAGPSFSEGKPGDRLSTNSATFVDVIHSSSNYLGFGGAIGHVDFYPNGPHKLQPGCGVDVAGMCSHNRSIYYFAESIYNPKAFLAVPCADWQQFQKQQCDLRRNIVMGEITAPTARGIHYLATKKESPFGIGVGWFKDSIIIKQRTC